MMIISLFLAAVAVSAQTAKPNFTGEWELETGRSVLPETMRIESMTMKVAQTDKELRVFSISSRSQSSKTDGSGNGNRVVTGGGYAYGTNSYSLDGKETTSDINNEMMTGKVTRKAAVETDGKLSLTATSNLETQMGSYTTKTNEVWELLDEGKTLKVTRYTETPRGATNAELYFTKKSPGATTGETNDTSGNQINNAPVVPKKISGGVLNGKAQSLPSPAYPAAARAVKASGAVNVQVTIDEAGNVSSASAVSGHPLLRSAAEEAARNAKFAPTMLQGVPVSVTGVIVYNFTP